MKKINRLQFAKPVRFKKKSETYVSVPEFTIDFDSKTGIISMVRAGEEDVLVLTSIANCAWMHCEINPKAKASPSRASKTAKE